MRSLYVLMICILSITGTCWGMFSPTRWYYKTEDFEIEVRKSANFYCVTEKDKAKTTAWINALNIDASDKEFIQEKIFQFLTMPDDSFTKVIDATEYCYDRYRFRLLDICKKKVVYKATIDHAEKVAVWLRQHGVEESSDEKERIKIINHGRFLSLKAKKADRYRCLLPEGKNIPPGSKLIAVLNNNSEECKDITREALSKASVTFHYKSTAK